MHEPSSDDGLSRHTIKDHDDRRGPDIPRCNPTENREVFCKSFLDSNFFFVSASCYRKYNSVKLIDDKYLYHLCDIKYIFVYLSQTYLYIFYYTF